MEYEKCFVFQPEDERPAKRRRTEPQGLQKSWTLRQKAFHAVWKSQRENIDVRLAAFNATTIDDILLFLEGQVDTEHTERIPTALILAGPSSALNTSVEFAIKRKANKRKIFASISSGSASSLKGVLKTIIQKATSRTIEDEDDDIDESIASRKGPRLLSYDLQILHDHIEERQIQQVVLSFEDTEAFDNEVLSELMQILACWQDRIPFVLLLNVATSVDFLQQKLTKAAIKCLNGRLFDAAPSADEVEQVIEAITSPETGLWLGSSLLASILERQQDYIQGIDSIVDAVHYAHMCCFYANPLSIFLDPNVAVKDISKDHFEALRNLPSFQDHARSLLGSGEIQQLRNVLHSDQDLFELATQSVHSGRLALSDVMITIKIIRSIQSCLPSSQATSKSALYVQAMSGKLNASPMLRALLLSVRKAPSNVAKSVLDALCALDLAQPVKAGIEKASAALDQLVSKQSDAHQPMRSEDDMQNSTFRTTVVAQKVELSKQKSALSKQDSAYTALLRQFSDTLESFFTEKLINPKHLPMHEIFIYDLNSPYREVFTPRPRHAIERALAAPHDYLDCECCAPGQEGTADDDEATLSASQPATAILYQLYLESGNLINANDLWQAFQAVLGDNAQTDSEQSTMALFQRALAELRYLGLVKSTRKRADHVAKVAWKGL